jgi:hypothetical protein
MSEINPEIQHIIDFTFLPGFNEPTLAILYQTNLTWTGSVLVPFLWTAILHIWDFSQGP